MTFDGRDCGVTLLKNDRVLLSLLVDTQTRKKRAANIRPKIPFTFVHTNEKRKLVGGACPRRHCRCHDGFLFFPFSSCKYS